MKRTAPPKIVCNNPAEWKIQRSVTSRGARRGVSGATESEIPPEFLATGRVVVEQTIVAEGRADVARRGLTAQILDLSVPTAAAEGCVLVAQHLSGALTFHAPEIGLRRGRAAAPGLARFRIPVRSVRVVEGDRRGVVGQIFKKIIKITVLKIIDKLVDLALPILARKWEENTWKKHGLSEGWLQFDLASFRSGKLAAWKPDAATLQSGRSLLLLHGTFSNAASAYSNLARSDFFERIAPIYNDRIFAFDHFTVSRTPEENAQMLVDALPSGRFEFDVVTHSRGGLVLRNLVERNSALGANAQRFQLGHAVLVASPNEGTPLATPDRWEKTVGLVANILSIFPDNPFTTAAEWVAESIVWLARHASGGLPGINSMDGRGDLIASLQDLPAPAPNAYSALVANYSPEPNLWERLLDVGIDGFFGIANDLVVPTEGGWRIDKGPESYIPAERIGCFGAGGNLAAPAVQHLNFFGQAETLNFLANALERKPQDLARLDASRLLPNRRGSTTASTADPRTIATVKASAVYPRPIPISTGSSAKITAATPGQGIPPAVPVSAPMAAPAETTLPVPTILTRETIPAGGVPRAQVVTTTDAWGRATAYLAPVEPPADENFNLFLAAPSNAIEEDQYYLLAGFRNARVLVDFPTKGGTEGKRWRSIIGTREHISGYIEGAPQFKELPNENGLRQFGENLFNTLFPGDIRRLYDHARAEFARPVGAQAAERRLNIIFTSMVGWVADKPWEFAYDPSRRTFLCAEDVNFVRNVLTAVPAEARLPRRDKLRILVVAAQPVGAVALSVDEEIAVIKRGFQPLIDAQLADVEIVPAVTPETLHELMQTSSYGNDPIDILHFIGHGEFRNNEARGYLVFENDRGGVQRIESEIVRQIVARRGIRLVFLNACETGVGYSGKLDFTSGIAPSLVAAGVPAVVANQFPVLDPSATAYARHFYWSLAQGRSVGDAAREARVAVNYSVTGEAIDWAVPVVFARNPFESLVIAPGATPPKVSIASAAVGVRHGRRGVGQERKPIAIWDVNHILPTLEQLVARMNQAQEVFFFEVADLTAPIGTWRRVRSTVAKGDKTKFTSANEGELHSNAVFEKLREVPGRLGVEKLICITNFWLTDGKVPNLFGDESDDEKIIIVSTAGLLPKLNEQETTIERLVTNQVAYANAGPIHRKGKGPKNCPMYYNAERDIRWIAGRLDLCAECRRILKQAANPQTVAAVEALLKLN